MDFSERERILLESGRLEETEGGWRCLVCGALCPSPGTGHARDCGLDMAVSMVAPAEASDRQSFLASMRMAALDKLLPAEIEECERLAFELLAGERPDATLREISSYCGEGALETGLLQRLAGTGTRQSEVSTLLMCERAWGRQGGETPVTPAVK